MATWRTIETLVYHAAWWELRIRFAITFVLGMIAGVALDRLVL